MSLEAFLAADFKWTRQLTSIWNDTGHTEQQLNAAALQEILEDFYRIDSLRDQALGDVIVGGAGAGKTHLMGSLRRDVLKRGHFFILLDFAGITDFWRSTALGFLNSLYQISPNGKEQFNVCLAQIAAGPGFDNFRKALGSIRARQNQGASPDIPERNRLVNLFLEALGRQYGQAGAMAHQAVVRAYLQLLIGDLDTRNSAYAWLQGYELDPDVLQAAGLPKNISPKEVVAGTLWMLSCVRNTLIAVDQIDSIVTEQNLASSPLGTTDATQGAVHSIVQSMAAGLMELYDLQGRGKTVVACLEATWTVLRTRVTVAATDRFRAPIALRPISSEDTAIDIVLSRLAKPYAEHDFRPDYPTWPFRRTAFSTALGMAPRTLLKACEAHRAKCRSDGHVTELTSMVVGVDTAPPPPALVDSLDQKFTAAKREAVVADLLDQSHEDNLKKLVLDTLRIYADEVDVGDDIDVAVGDDRDLQRPSLHARLVFTFRTLGDRERHFCFRVLPHANAVAFQSRLRAAMTASGLDRALAFRHLVVIRRSEPPSGAKTAALARQFTEAGGLFIDPSDEELRTMRALFALRAEPGFGEWLRETKPFAQLSMFSCVGLNNPVQLDPPPVPKNKVEPPKATAALAPRVTPRADTMQPSLQAPLPAEISKATDRVPNAPAAGPAFDTQMLPVGRRLEGGKEGRAAVIPVPVIARHIAILAGAGAGKTVLVRRLIEESAMRGIPAVVLDSNNDLSTLGEEWPSSPSLWGPDDAVIAEKYHSRSEVIIWTPGLSRGRPITLDVLPDFGALSAGTDEFNQAIDMALNTVSSVVKLTDMKKGVLADALKVFGANGGGDLDEFVGLLQDLPLDASRISKASKMAAEVGNQLLAAMSTNPLLRSGGAALKPHTLFTSEDPSKTRISVINFVGLPSDESRQEFVNRLQMSLFTWIKKEPRELPRLYVVDEARNFMPSGKPAASKDSAISLAAQARKYGLGLIVATQTPKDIDNRIISNSTSHFYGKMNSPAAIETVRELMANKGSAASDIAALPSGTFYFSTEGSSLPVKIKTAMCLSYHPANPPGEEDVIKRALHT
jgi:hypothetical protein